MRTLNTCYIAIACLGLGFGSISICLAEDEERGERGIIIAPSESKPKPGTSIKPESTSQPSILPALPPVNEPDETLSNIANIRVTRIYVEGNTVLSEADILAVVAPYENRLISIGELHDLRYKLSLLYFNHGYVTSGVIIPDQKVEDGIIRLQVIEGRLTQLEIDGNKRLRDSYLVKRIAIDMDAPLNTNEMQGELRVLQSNPLIRQVNAQLLPGVNTGESTLRVNVKESQNYWLRVTADNYRSPSVDETQTSLSVGHSNLTGNGDELGISMVVTEGLNDYGVSYAYPITRRDLVLRGYYSQSDSAVVEEPFDLIDIKSDTETWGIELSRPFRSDSGRLLVASAGFEHKRATNTLLGIPFSFSPGERDGESAVSVVRFSTDWLWQKPQQAFGISTGIRVGVDALDVTINDDDPDSRFVSFQGQVQLARKLAWRNSQLILRSAAQFSPDPLLPLEKFAVGGNSTVRGYRENTFVRDNGVVASAELRVPLFVDDDGVDIMNMAIVPFADYGIAWDTDDDLPTSDKEDIYSIGLGIRWAIKQGWFFQAAYGYALKDMDNPTDSLQDRGFHFQLTYSLITN